LLSFSIPSNPGVPGMITRHQGTTRWCANRAAGVTLSESNSFPGQPVDVRCGESLLPVTAQIAVAQVIGVDENDVGPWRGIGAESASAEDTKKRQD
jgi:hypothetical protein